MKEFADDEEFNKQNYVPTNDDKNATGWKGPWVQHDTNSNGPSNPEHDAHNEREIKKAEERIARMEAAYKKLSKE